MNEPTGENGPKHDIDPTELYEEGTYVSKEGAGLLAMIVEYAKARQYVVQIVGEEQSDVSQALSRVVLRGGREDVNYVLTLLNRIPTLIGENLDGELTRRKMAERVGAVKEKGGEVARDVAGKAARWLQKRAEGRGRE